jgi:hypothetical protein
MSDQSTQNPNSYAKQMATALLRANGGTTANLLMPPATADTSDAGQLGINPPEFQSLPLSPVVFRRVRATMVEGDAAKYELLIAAASVEAAVGNLELASADALFAMAAGVVVGGKLFFIEAHAVSENLGEVYMYRLTLRESTAVWPMSD